MGGFFCISDIFINRQLILQISIKKDLPQKVFFLIDRVRSLNISQTSAPAPERADSRRG